MKKILGVALSVVVLTLSISAFAQESVKVKGKVTKIDAAAKSVTIQPKEGDAVTVVMEDGDLLDKVREGQNGQAIYVVKDGKNIGSKLKKLSAGCE